MNADQLNIWINTLKEILKEPLEINVADKELLDSLIHISPDYDREFYEGVLAGIRAYRMLLDLSKTVLPNDAKQYTMILLQHIMNQLSSFEKKKRPDEGMFQ